jgi:hypothetical protein
MSAVKRLFRFDYTAAAGHMKMPSAYSERYEKRFGFWRPVIGDVVRKFLRCGDLHFGFARVRCSGSECAHEMFVPFSCRQRCLCPSCHQKRALLLADRMAHQICLPVPHRQYVWTIPKRLRIYFRHDRRLLGRLSSLAWETILETYRELAGDQDALPGMIAGIQTFGELLHFHPHVHALVTDGVFLPDGTFRQLPHKNGTGSNQDDSCLSRFRDPGNDPVHDLWRRKVFDLPLSEGKIDQETIDQIDGTPAAAEGCEPNRPPRTKSRSTAPKPAATARRRASPRRRT